MERIRRPCLRSGRFAAPGSGSRESVRGAGGGTRQLGYAEHDRLGSYLSDFGRPATTQETTYWASVNPTDPRIASREAFLANNKSFLKSNAAERQATIARAYQATWNVNLPANSKEMQYWDPLVAGGQIVYSGLKRANDLTRTANPNYRPGQSLTVPLNPPANYGLLSAEDSSLRGMLSMLAAALKPFEIMQSGLAKAGDEYLHGPTPPKTASTPPVELAVLPAMRIRNPMNFSGPFILASTYHENPALSFCLDTGSWDAGATVVAVPCHGGDSQLFNVDSSNRIVMAKNAKGLTLCLDGGDKPWPGDPRKKTVVLNTCSNSKTQQWYVNTIPGLRDGTPYVNDFWQRDLNYRSSGQIQNVGNGFCIDIEGGRTGASNPVIAYDCIPRKMGSPRPWNQVWGAGHILQTGAAYVFLRYDPPGPAGHTGWGIQLADGSWEGGTFDGPEEGRIFNIKVPGAVEKGDNNYAWRHHFASEAQLRAYFGEGKIAENPPYRVKGYDRYYKWQLRGTLNTAAAFSLESQSWDWGYGVLGNNCLDVTYKVLRAYGWNLPAPAHSGDIVQYAPKTWFLNLMGGTEPLWLHGQ
jgi:Ricin-type beta-trefoil lectin domain.